MPRPSPPISFSNYILRLIIRQFKEGHAAERSPDSESYWTSAANLCQEWISVLRDESRSVIHKGEEAEWMDEDAVSLARRIAESISAATKERQIYQRQAARIEQGSIPRLTMTLFTISRIQYLEIEPLPTQDRLERLERNPGQSAFKKSLIQAYCAAIVSEKTPRIIAALYDSATGFKVATNQAIEWHLVPHKLRPDVLVALFGVNVEEELNTPLNGLLLDSIVCEALEDGAIAIVPDSDDNPTPEMVQEWEEKQPRNYRWRIVDDEAPVLDKAIAITGRGSYLQVRDLDKRRVSFQTEQCRPSARYLFFHYVMAQLRLVWKDPGNVPKSQAGKGFWGAQRDGYLSPGLMLVLSEELRHNTDFRYDGLALSGDSAKEQDMRDEGEIGLLAIAKIIQSQEWRDAAEFNDEEPPDVMGYYA
ncbi:hypothetical protein OQA88_11478 [Cercophora sp. LCS_1]